MKISKQCTLSAQCDTYSIWAMWASNERLKTIWPARDMKLTYSFESKIIYMKSNIQTCLLLCFYASLKFWKGWHKKCVDLIGICWLRIWILSRRYLLESASMPITAMTKLPTLWKLKHVYYKLESHSGHRHKHTFYFLVFSRAGRGHWMAQSEIQVSPKLLKFAVSTTRTANETWSVKFREKEKKSF